MANPPQRRRLLIVSPSFPPINTPDMQRVRMSLAHYIEHGWEPVVLAVDPSKHGGPRDENLKATVPSGIRIYHASAIPVRWARWFGIGNLGLRAWWSLLRAGAKILREEQIDLVFFSNTQFITFTLGRIWRRRFGVPFAIDLQDPWQTDYYKGPRKQERPGGWKYTFAQFQARILEGWSMHHMSALMSVSPHYIDALRLRYRWFTNIPTDTIGFGASEADLAEALKLPSTATMTTHSNSRIRIISTGAAGPIMQPALRVLFDGLATFAAATSDSGLGFEFYGTSYAPAKTAQPSVLPLAQELRVAKFVSETPTRLGHLEALRVQIEADALLLLGTTDPNYTASKLYPYFLSGRPMLAVLLRGSLLEQQVRQLSCATVVIFDESGPTAETRFQLQAFFAAAVARFPIEKLPERNEELFRSEYFAPSLTARQCALFDAALSYQSK